MIFYIGGRKIPIDEQLVEKYIASTHVSKDTMQLILTVILRNIIDLDNTQEIFEKYTEREIKNILEAQLKKELY